MISNANKTPERERYLIFTEAYLNTPAIIISDSNNGFIDTLDRLAGKRVTLEKGYFMQELLMHDHPEIQLIPAENVHDALRHGQQRQGGCLYWRCRFGKLCD